MQKAQRKLVLVTLSLITILAFSSLESAAGQSRAGRAPTGFMVSALQSPNVPEAPDWVAPPWSQIVYESWEESDGEIYLAGGDGLNPIRLTTNNQDDKDPRLNRGCTRIAFTSQRDGNYEIYTMKWDGSDVTRLTTHNSVDGNPAWSPDGSLIAFESSRDGDYEIYVMPSTGGAPTQLTVNATGPNGYDGEPAWSPDGTKIAFISKRLGDYFVWVMDANGSNPGQVSTISSSEDPAWSPDGTQIAFDADSDADGYYELWVVNANVTNEHKVEDLGNQEKDLFVNSWSPDGRYIAVTKVEYVPDTGEALSYLSAWDTQPPSSLSSLTRNKDYGPDWQACEPMPPSSSVNALPAFSSESFLVSWSGSDPGGSGVANYDIQVRVGLAGTWTDWQVGTDSTSQTYTGVVGETYYFRSRARDNQDNIEAWPADYDATTTVQLKVYIPQVMR